MQRRDKGVARATGATRDSGITEYAQEFLRMRSGVVKIARERMYHTCCRDFFIATRFPFYVKAGFFLLVLHCFFHYFGPAKASKLDLNFELSWRSSWEASWSDVGPMLGGFWESSWSQVGPKTVQDGAKTGQVGAKMAQDGAKTG